MKKLLILGVALLTLLFSACSGGGSGDNDGAEPNIPAASAEAPSPDTIDRSVVRLFIGSAATVNYSYGGKVYTYEIEAGSSCTGWFASTKGDIATAGHCVDPANGRVAVLKAFLQELNAPEEQWEATLANAEIASEVTRTVYAYQPESLADRVLKEPVVAQVVDFVKDEDGDHALLRLNNIGYETPALKVGTADPARGTEINAIGFPGSVTKLHDDQRLQATFNKGEVSAHQTNKSGVPFTQHNASVDPGMSGGPVVDDSTQEVYGVNSYAPTATTGDFEFMTDTTDMRAFLSKNGVALV